MRYSKEWSLHFLIAAVFILAAALVLQACSRSKFFPPRESLSSLPTQIGSWTGLDINLGLDQQTMNSFAPQETLLREYQNTNQPELPVVLLFIDYLQSGNAAQIHAEWKHCLPGGWVPTLREVVEISRPDGSSFLANRYVVSKEGDRELVLNWYQAHGRAVASEFWAKFYLVADSIRMNRTDGALVQLTTHMTDGESPDAAQVRVMRLGSQLAPMLDRYIPR